MSTSDLVVAGGGPAGLATAIRARAAGLEVTVLDAAEPPIDKACGEGLMPDGVEALGSLGVDIDGIEARAFHGIRYVDGERSAEGRFPGMPGLGIRRTVLHLALASRARDIGVELRWGSRVLGLADGGFLTSEGRVTGRWLVGADGRVSRVRKWAGLGGPPARRRRIGIRRHYEIEPWNDCVEVHWGEGCEAYVTPVGESLVGVAILWEGGSSSFERLLARLPALESRLADVTVASTDRGAGPLEQRCRRVTRGNLALVGDAGGYLDPLTGEGLALAFHQAEAVVEAILGGRIGLYRAAHRRIGRYPNAVTRLLLEVERRPGLRRRVLRSLTGDATLMSRFLALKMRSGGPKFLGPDGMLALVARAYWGPR